MIEKSLDELLYLEVDGFGDENIKHCFSSRIGWDQENIFTGIEKIFNVESKSIFRAKQVHGNNVLIIDEQDNKDIFDCELDGFVTNRKNVVLSTFHADCGPLYFYDKEQKVIGVAHSGWRGTLENITKNILDIMINKYNSNIKDIEVAIGPTICVNCYEVKEDVANLFIKEYGNNIIKKNKDKLYLDLWKANRLNILNYGVLEENLYESNYCTSCNIDKLYSYRKEKGTKGRMITGIMLRNL